jgi:hypothetical protein
MGSKFGFSWSWKRATGLSAAKGKISRKIGIPLTKSGRQRKLGRMVGGVLWPFAFTPPKRDEQVEAWDSRIEDEDEGESPFAKVKQPIGFLGRCWALATAVLFGCLSLLCMAGAAMSWENKVLAGVVGIVGAGLFVLALRRAWVAFT